MGQRIAVVVASFNQGLMVREAVSSVLAQSRRPDDVVVVDDGSTDRKSLDVLASLDTDGVRVLRQANSGVSAARNAGIASVTADFVAVLDGDDRFRPDFLAAMVPEFVDDDAGVDSA